MSHTNDAPIVIGKIGASHGVRGWLRVFSYTEPTSNLFNYTPWYLLTDKEQRPVQLSDHGTSGKYLIAKLDGIDTPEQANQLTHSQIVIQRNQLPDLPKDEYYWSDLTGLTVKSKDGKIIGNVDSLLNTGANDILVVKNQQDNELLIPYIDGTVIAVNLTEGTLIVDPSRL